MADAGLYDSHDRAVAERINGYISQANTTLKKASVAEKLEWCWAKNIHDRESDSTDPVGRDADYYFAARHVIAADSSQFTKFGHAAIGTAATVIYNGLKVATAALGVEKVMRTDRDKPNSPPGGLVWEIRGAKDGFADTGGSVNVVRPHLRGDISSESGYGVGDFPTPDSSRPLV